MLRRQEKLPAEKFILRAKALPEPEAKSLMSRMRGKFIRRREDKRLNNIEVLALQLEHEDDELKSWRQGLARIRQQG